MKNPHLFLEEKISAANQKLYAAAGLLLLTGLFFVPVPYSVGKSLLNVIGLFSFIGSLLITRSTLPVRQKYTRFRKEGGYRMLKLEITDKFKILRLVQESDDPCEVQFEYYLVSDSVPWRLADELTCIFRLAQPGTLIQAAVLVSKVDREIIDVETNGLDDTEDPVPERLAITGKVASEGKIIQVTKTGYVLESYFRSKSLRYFFVISDNSIVEVDKDTFDSTPVFAFINVRPKIFVSPHSFRKDAAKKLSAAPNGPGYGPYTPKLLDQQ
jgi:hypothetical protein